MEQLRQRVLASCHLGPLTQEETRAYVEHRLRHVGWTNRPSFDEAAFGSIYGWTGGIPRKINLLCNRLLLAAYLNDANEIGVDLVELTGREIVRETGGTRAIPEAAPNVALPLAVVPPGPVEEAELAEPADVESEFSVLTSQLEYVWRACHQLDDLVRPLVCVADSPLSYLKIATLAKALKVDGGLPPVVLVNPGQVHEVEAEQLPDDLIEAVAAEIHLGVTGGTVAERLGSIALRFGEVSRQLVPSAAITCGSTDAVLTCALVAGKARMPLGRLGAGQRIGSQRHATDLNAALVDRMSDILYTPMLKTHYALYREGIAAERMVCVGSLLADGLHQVTANMPPVSELLKGLGLSRDQLRRALRGFALVTAQADEDELSTSDLTQVARVARDLGKETLVVWPVSEATSRSIAAGKANALLQRSGVVLVPRPRYADQIGLVRGATCVIAGPGWSCVEEADCLDIPSIVLYPGGDVPTAPPGGVIAKIPCDSVACVRALHEILERGRPEDELADDARGAASARVLEHLRRWLPTKALPIKASPR
jgi:UDP-N-acetylglucosamine 2-epimerase